MGVAGEPRWGDTGGGGEFKLRAESRESEKYSQKKNYYE